MKINVTQAQVVALALIFIIILSGCQQESVPAVEDPPEAAEASQLATARVSAQLSGPGQATVTGHNNLQYVVDAAPSSEGLNEIDTLLAAQSTCAVFVAEKAAQELDVQLTNVTSTTVFDEDNQQVLVYLDLPGVDNEDVLELANNFRQRCPVYTTLSEAESIEFTPGEQFEGGTSESAIVTATIFQFGRADVTAHGNTFVMDSVPPLNGPNEELNPLDLMLGGLAACGTFIYENENPSADATITVEGDFDPSGVQNLEGENPRIQNLRILMQLDEETQADNVREQIEEQCYLYKTLNDTVNIEFLTE